MTDEQTEQLARCAKLLRSAGLHREALTTGEIDPYSRKRIQANERLKIAIATEPVIAPIPTRSGEPLDFMLVVREDGAFAGLSTEEGWRCLLDLLDETEAPEGTKFTGYENTEEYMNIIEGRDQHPDPQVVTINGIEAASYIKHAYNLGDDLSGPGLYDRSDPKQTALRRIRDWITMAEQDALDNRRTNRDQESEVVHEDPGS